MLYSKMVLAAVMVCLSAAPGSARAGTFTTVFDIPGHNDGGHPVSSLTRLDGKYYGTTAYGGPNGAIEPGNYGGFGTVYQIDPRTGVETVIYAFKSDNDGSYPEAGLTAFNGKLYGTTSSGGVYGGGVIFSIDPVSDTETVVSTLSPGATPRSKLTEFNGLLYGTATSCGTSSPSGCIFSVDPGAAGGRIVYAFPASGREGNAPGDLIARDGFLYGTAYTGGTADGGTLFRFDPATATNRIEHVFAGGSDGSYPNSDLVEKDGVFYGTTSGGGTSSVGVIFAFTPAMRQESVVHAFSGPEGSRPSNGLFAYNGLLYGGTDSGGQAGDTVFEGEGAVYAFDPASNTVTVVHAFTYAEGNGAVAPLTAVDGLLYGVLYAGGLAQQGQVYSVDPVSGSFTSVHVFAGQQVGGASGLTKAGNVLYGSATGGGANGLGSIFKVEPKRGTGFTVYSFDAVDGAYPKASLLDVVGTLYGTTSVGGSGGGGTVFSLAPDSRVLTTLFAFANGKRGSNPVGPLATLDGVVFGTTTYGGGQGGRGVVFKIDLATRHESTVATLTDATGTPATGLIAANGLLYGTASTGGAFNKGTIFEVDPSRGMITVLYSFMDGADGSTPLAPLFYSGGLLYGTTNGSPQARATVFEFDPVTHTKTILNRLGRPLETSSALTQKGDKLFSPFVYEGEGGLFQFDLVTDRVKYNDSPYSEGFYPDSALTLSVSALFGTTIRNTTANAGTVFKFIPDQTDGE